VDFESDVEISQSVKLQAYVPHLCRVQVYYVMGKMEETGCDLFIDVHGDEELTYNFIAGIEGIPSWDDRLHKLQVRQALLCFRSCGELSPTASSKGQAPFRTAGQSPALQFYSSQKACMGHKTLNGAADWVSLTRKGVYL